MIEDLQTFVKLLKSENQLVEVDVEVDSYLEAAEIHRRVIEQQGQAILFNNVKGSPYPLVTNLFGTTHRIDLAFGKKPSNFVRELASLPVELLPPSLGKVWQKRSLFFDLLRVGTKQIREPVVSGHTESPAKLSELPLLTTWEEDGGAFVTLPLVLTQDPETNVPNLGMYRMQRYSDTETGLHCQIGKGGGFHLSKAKSLGINLPVNVFIGGPPALILSAIAPLPENVPELLLCSLIMGKKLALSKSPYSSLPIISNAEFALVGECNPDELRAEGPFGDHYGYYSLMHDYPVFRCKAVHRRKNPVCAATVVGKPKQEDFFLGDYLQELLSPLFPVVMPAVKDLWSYGETGYHSLAAAVVQERYKRECMMSAFRILGEGQLSLTKFLLLIDRKIDLKDFRAVLQYVLERADFGSDLFVFANLSFDTLDYTAPKINEGSKGVLLGIGDKLRELPREFVGELPSFVSEAVPFCPGCLCVSGSSYRDEKDLPKLVAASHSFRDWPLIILVDEARSVASSSSSFLWTTFTRFEPAADIHAHETRVERNHICYQSPIVIDARNKPWYPKELECDPKTKALVDSRWSSYF